MRWTLGYPILGPLKAIDLYLSHRYTRPLGAELHYIDLKVEEQRVHGKWSNRVKMSQTFRETLVAERVDWAAADG